MPEIPTQTEGRAAPVRDGDVYILRCAMCGCIAETTPVSPVGPEPSRFVLRNDRCEPCGANAFIAERVERRRPCPLEIALRT